MYAVTRTEDSEPISATPRHFMIDNDVEDYPCLGVSGLQYNAVHFGSSSGVDRHRFGY